MVRPRHPKKAVEAAVRHAESIGWRFEKRTGHNWGRLFCPYGHPDCQIGVYSTPRNLDEHAKMIQRPLQRCPGS
jgi:hypothetical protein